MLILFAATFVAAQLQDGNQPARMVRHVAPPPPLVEGEGTCLPMQLSGVMPVITAKVAQRDVNLGFDTGAPGSPMLDPSIIADLKLEQVGEVRMTDPSQRNAVTAGLYAMRDFRLGSLSVPRWQASARPPRPQRRLGEPDGIVGLAAFHGYVVTLDFPGGRLLAKKGRLPPPDGKVSFGYQGPIPSVPLTIDGKSVEAHVDTGNARYGLIIPDTVARQLAGFGNRFPIGVARTINNRFDLMAQPVAEARVGDLPLNAGAAAFPTPGNQRANIGALLLRDWVVKIDPANRVISLERAQAGLETGCPNA